MFCRTCGKSVADHAVACMACGSPPRAGNKFCWSCGTDTNTGAVICVKCGVSLTQGGGGAPQAGLSNRKSRLTAGLLNLLLPMVCVGGIGRLYLGYTGIGVWQLVVGIVTCGIGGLWSFIDGIMILTGTPATDSKGEPLQ